MHLEMSGRWRPIAVLVVGAVVAGALVAPVLSPQGASAVTTYTRYVSCAGSSFYPIDSDTSYGMTGTARIRPTTAGSGIFRCDPGLPNGAVVTKVRFTQFDQTVSGSIGPCYLKRAGLTTATATAEDVMASISNSGFSPGTIRPEDTTISFATVDASKYAYWLECGITGGDLFLGLHGADVTFTITAAKG